MIVVLFTTLALFLPDSSKTPGQADPTLTKDKLCATNFHTGQVRDVDQSLKDKVYASYGMVENKTPCPCEVDHLVSIEIGGAETQSNLWPQPYNTKPWNAHVKDKLENRLHKLVCKGKVTLEEAQQAIASNWIVAYKKYMVMK